jgi:2-polyprenyl-3-methyl-5-hydroxy-6-metoxy-1,4-benzoquinol methylase
VQSVSGGNMSSPVEIPIAPGRFNRVEYSGQSLRVAGWMFLPGRQLDGYRLQCNGAALASETAPLAQDGVAAKFPAYPEARNSGFAFASPISQETFGDWAEIEVFGRIQGSDVCRLSVLYRVGYEESLPQAPTELRRRVSGVPASRTPIANHWLAGLETFSKFYQPIRKYMDPTRVRRLLDWGCGCGRVTGLLLKYLDGVEVYGCDIDRETIEWCAEHFPRGCFSTVATSPPTDYADGFFDVVVACSVMTHLSQEKQDDWLRELRRIIAPGGLAALSVNGEFLARAYQNPSFVVPDFESTGISDRALDPILKGITPEGYYRTTYQSKAHTEREFARHFKILEYVDHGMGNLQDLVVMRKE